jgi:hypothetical protein
MAARAQTIVVAPPPRRNPRSFYRRARRAVGRARRSAGVSVARLREKQNLSFMVLGGTSSLVFGLLQRKVVLPGIPGVPNSLTYGAGGTALALLVKSDKLLKCAMGPLMAGVHNVALKGLSGSTVSGEWDETSGEWDETAGEVTAGEFDDL